MEIRQDYWQVYISLATGDEKTDFLKGESAGKRRQVYGCHQKKGERQVNGKCSKLPLQERYAQSRAESMIR